MTESDARVEQYLLLAKGAKGPALADLIAKACADPQLFAFGELLSLPAVQEVRLGMGRAGKATQGGVGVGA